MKTGAGVHIQQTGDSGFGAGMAPARREGPGIEDIRKAMAFRERFGGGWLAAARVVGCTEHALRLACDPAYRPVHAPARAVGGYRPAPSATKAGAAERVGGTRVLKERGPRERGPGSLPAGVLVALADSPMGSTALGMRLGRDKTAINGALKPLKAEGLAVDTLMGDGRALRWSLTRAGVAEAERLRDLIEQSEDCAE
ncbi:MAG: hypothetical protein Q8L23_15810 [Caulobacter sp.]|nr:hypothetical protein [Caulobacter sp.]